MLSTILSGAKDIYRRDFAHLADQHDCCFSMLKMSQNFNHNFQWRKKAEELATAMPQWFCLRPPSCGPRFESQAHHQSIFNLLCWNWNCNWYWNKRRTKIKQKGRDWPYCDKEGFRYNVDPMVLLNLPPPPPHQLNFEFPSKKVLIWISFSVESSSALFILRLISICLDFENFQNLNCTEKMLRQRYLPSSTWARSLWKNE